MHFINDVNEDGSVVWPLIISAVMVVAVGLGSYAVAHPRHSVPPSQVAGQADGRSLQ